MITVAKLHFFGKYHQFTQKNVMRNSDFVRAKNGLLSE